MPLYLSHRRPLSLRAKYAIAFGLLGVMLVGLLGWLAVRYMGSRPQDEQPSDSSSAVTYTANDNAVMLLILTDNNNERFMLIQASPVNTAVFVAPLPAETTDGTGQTLTDILKKNGPAKATAAAAAATGVPVSRYMALTTEKAESFLADLGGSLPFTLPETVQFTDSQGASVRLEAGEQALSAAQIAGLLRYNLWSAPAVGQQVHGELLTTLLNQYMLPTRSLRGDFAALSNLASTNLRIDDYTAYHQQLMYLANANALTPVCRRVNVAGEWDENGRFVPDKAALTQLLAAR